MILPAGRYIPILNIRLFDGEEMRIDGEFEIVFSRRCAGTGIKPPHGLQMDFFAQLGTKVTILKDNEEIRRYG